MGFYENLTVETKPKNQIVCYLLQLMNISIHINENRMDLLQLVNILILISTTNRISYHLLLQPDSSWDKSQFSHIYYWMLNSNIIDKYFHLMLPWDELMVGYKKNVKYTSHF